MSKISVLVSSCECFALLYCSLIIQSNFWFSWIETRQLQVIIVRLRIYLNRRLCLCWFGGVYLLCSCLEGGCFRNWMRRCGWLQSNVKICWFDVASPKKSRENETMRRCLFSLFLQLNKISLTGFRYLQSWRFWECWETIWQALFSLSTKSIYLNSEV